MHVPAATSPFQATVREAGRQLSLGLMAVSDDPMGYDLTRSTVGSATALTRNALDMPATSGAIQDATRALDSLASARTALGAVDDDGYPLRLREAVGDVRTALQLLVHAGAEPAA